MFFSIFVSCSFLPQQRFQEFGSLVLLRMKVGGLHTGEYLKFLTSASWPISRRLGYLCVVFYLLFAVRASDGYRFKDGSIVEAVVWKGKGAQRHRVVEQVTNPQCIFFVSGAFL